MRIYIRRKLERLVGYLEIIIAIAVTLVIAICIGSFVVRVVSEPFAIQTAERFYQFLDDALSLIIGIEFLKMLIIPTSDNVIETLLFAVSRHIILDHGTDVMILGVLSVAILFLIKKYFLSEFDEISSYHFRGSTTVNSVNATMQSDLIPDEANQSIGQFVVNRLKEENKPVEKGSSINIDGFIIRLGSLDKITGLPKKVSVHPTNETEESSEDLSIVDKIKKIRENK